MQYTAQRFGIRQNLIPVHHPQANPVERKHRDLKTIMAIAVQQNHGDWDEILPASRFAMNTASTQATGFLPAYLVYSLVNRVYTYLLRFLSSSTHISISLIIATLQP